MTTKEGATQWTALKKEKGRGGYMLPQKKAHHKGEGRDSKFWSSWPHSLITSEM